MNFFWVTWRCLCSNATSVPAFEKLVFGSRATTRSLPHKSARPYKQPRDKARCAAELRSQAERGFIDTACVEVLLGDDAGRLAIRARFAG